MKIGLLGASFDTGNLGVSALAESSIKVILRRWPDAEVVMLGGGAADTERCLKIWGRKVHVGVLRIRFCPNVFLRSHFMVLFLNALLLKLMPWKKVRGVLSAINPHVRTLLEMDKVYDITAGDSFSDIYGLLRFLKSGFLRKWLVMLFGKELILLPQTYGPYKRPVSRFLARHVLRCASAVYARDRAGVEYVRALLGNGDTHAKVRFAPDVAFVLDAHEPDKIDVGSLRELRTKESIVVGLNISGLLFNGGYTRQNMFGLKTDYRELIQSVIEFLLLDEKLLVLLVPHVLTPGWIVEDDPNACRQMYEQLGPRYPDRVFIAGGLYNQNDVKYIIRLCDFFIGSRMHSCIAALSQCIPTVGIAYSKKFRGVFESVGLGDCVADACQSSKDELLSTIRAALERRDKTRVHLERIIPEVQSDVLNMLDV